MEEDIKILENAKYEMYEQIEEHKEDKEFVEGQKEVVQALENLIKGYRELEENKKLKTIKGFEENIEVSKFGEWVGKNYIDYKFEYENYQRILADSIPKSKIKEKIEELEEEKKYYYSDYKIEELNDKIQVLQELMEDK